jgi:hypothetical protein
MAVTPTLRRIDEAREESLETVFETLFPGPDTATGVDDETVRAALCQCRGDNISAQLERMLGGQSLSARQKGRIQLARHVLRAYFAQPAFHPDLARALLAESGGLLARALTPGGWLMRHGRDPAHELLSLVGRVAMGWSPEDRRADEARDMLCSWVRALGRNHDSDHVVAVARARVADFDQIADRRVASVRSQDEGLSAAAARQRAARAINQTLAGRQQPPFMARSLHQDWWPALQRVFMDEGEHSERGKRLVRVLTLVIWALQPREDVAREVKKLNRVARDISRDLPLALAESLPEAERREELVDRIEVALYSIIHGRQVPREPVEPLDEREPAGARCAHPNADSPWFERVADAQRMWLVSAEDEEDCLFFDLFGRRVLQGAPGDIQARLDRGELRPVPAPVPTPQLVRTHLNQLKRRTRRGRLRHKSRQTPPERAGS